MEVIVKTFYAALATIGFILPYYFFISFLLTHGLDLPLFVEQLFASPISTFFAVDLILTALALLIFSYYEARRLAMRKWWLVAISTLLIGPPFSLPLFLYMRHDHL